jgi:hypothetical protein
MFRWLCPRRKSSRNLSILSQVFTPESAIQFETMIEDIRANIDNQLIESLANRFSSLKCVPLSLSAQFPSKIGYIPIMEEAKKFNLCMFYLPPNSVLPFHNHPNQHVLLKVVLGHLDMTSFDIINDSSHHEVVHVGKEYPTTSRTTEIVSSRDEGAKIVYPNRRNVHRISTKSEGALFMDFVFPPYDHDHSIAYFEDTKEEGRVRAVSERDVCLDMQLVSLSEIFQHN